LSRRKGVFFANLNTFVPRLPFGGDFFFSAIDSFHFHVLGRSIHGGMADVPTTFVSLSWQVQECRSERSCESGCHWLLSAKAAAVDDMFYCPQRVPRHVRNWRKQTYGY
jgi:hypothetical protein